MRHLIIRLLFWLLGHSSTRQFNVPFLFGASPGGHDARKKNWERALLRLWKDKHMIDFLYYQAENDKENVFRRKIPDDLARGARLRTLFLVYSAHRAHILSQRKRTRNTPSDVQGFDEDTRALQKAYNEVTDIPKQRA